MSSQTLWRRPVDLQKSPRVFDFFCGCGGSSLGLQASGMDIAFGLDNDPDAAKTYKANFPDAAFICADIAEVPTSALYDVVESSDTRPDLCRAANRQR